MQQQAGAHLCCDASCDGQNKGCIMQGEVATGLLHITYVKYVVVMSLYRTWLKPLTTWSLHPLPLATLVMLRYSMTSITKTISTS